MIRVAIKVLRNQRFREMQRISGTRNSFGISTFLAPLIAFMGKFDKRGASL